MPIEFRCPQCNQLLRTPDDTAGKQAKCPECGAIASVPAPPSDVPDETLPYGSVPPPGPPPPPSPFADSGEASGSPFGPGAPPPPGYAAENPYASPGEYAPVREHYAAAPGAITPTRIDFEDVFRRTWDIFKVEWGMCLVVMLVVFGISALVGVMVRIPFFIAAVVAGDMFVADTLGLIGDVITIPFSIWLGIGLNLYFLKVARGQRAELGEIFNGGRYFLPVLGATILVELICLLGFLACIIPGIILALMFSQYYMLIIDRNVGVMDSLSISQSITTGNKLMLLAIWLVTILVGTVLVICTCGLGLLAVVPYLGLMGPVIYLTMTGQPTADQLYGRQL